MAAHSSLRRVQSIHPSTEAGPGVLKTLRSTAFQAYQANLPDICKIALEKIVQLAPSDPGLYIFELCESARRHSLDGRHFDALEAVNQALALDPTSEIAALRLLQASGFAGERLIRDGNVPQGMPFLDLALNLNPEDAALRNVAINAFTIQAIEALALGEIEPALSSFRDGSALANFELAPLQAINFCISQAVRPDTVALYQLVLLSLLHNFDLSPDSVRSIGMGAGALRNVAAQSRKLGERTLESAALRLQIMVWGGNADADQRLAELNQIVNKTMSVLRQQLFLSDRNTICYSPFVGHHGRPNGNYGTTPQYLDRDGFPNASPPDMPKSEARRIFVLGDSTIYNGDGSLDTTIPARMQSILHARGDADVRIYNYSIPGCTFHQPLALISSLLLDYEPDEIIINIGGVDSVIHKNYDPRPGYPMWGFLFELAQEQCQRTSADADYGGRDEWRDLAERWLDMRHGAGSDLGDDFCERVAEEFRRALVRLGRFANAYDIPVCVTLQPISQMRRSLSNEEGGLASAKALDLITRQYHAFQRVAFPDQSRLTQWSKRLKVIDITDVFDDYEGTIFTDHVHYNTVGRERMSARLIKILDEGI